MDLVQAFIKDQFNDDDDYYEKKKKNDPKREMQNLKKELEEIKFYQELERTEFEDMKRKAYAKDKQKKRGTQRLNVQQALTNETGNSNDVFGSLSEDGGIDTNPKHLAELRKKDQEIEKLKKSLKTETSPKEFGKRMHKLEKVKNEEIEEIKNHYKGLMEQLAKQIQKSNGRNDDEIGKNDLLRKSMEEMRQDMATREQELEEKILEMEAVLKKSEYKANKFEQRLAIAEENLATTLAKLSEAKENELCHQQSITMLEDDFEEERKDTLAAHERELEMKLTKFNEEISNFKEESDELSNKLNGTLEKLEIEERAHEDTVVQLKDTERTLQATGENNESLKQETKNAINEARLHRIQADSSVQDAKEDRKTQLGECHEKINILQSEKLSLTTELKTKVAKLFAAEKKIGLLDGNTVQKQGALRRKNAELEELQLELRGLSDKRNKDSKFKELQMVKERKKWVVTESVLRKDLEEIKMSPAYQRLLMAKKPQISTATDSELRDLVEQLMAEKASLLLRVSAIKSRSTRDIGKLEKRLITPNDEASTHVLPKKETPAYNTMKRTISFASASSTTVAPASSKTSTLSPYEVYNRTTSSSNMSVASGSSAEVSVSVAAGTPKVNRQSLSTSEYRKQLRQRKLSAKAAE
jgi:hypothetical protein